MLSLLEDQANKL